MTTPEIFVVIPSWNGAKFLKPCIDSLLAQSVKCSIIVIENGSIDDSDKVLATYKNKIAVLKQTKNLGFAGGVNVGIKYALENKANYVALFNNDAIADKDWLKQLLATANTNRRVGIIASNLMQMDKVHIDSNGDCYCKSGLPFPRGRNEVQSGQYNKRVDVFGACAGAALYKTEVFEDIGLFDERFFAYFEDVDLSFRARLRGWQIKYNPEALAYHHISATGLKMGNFIIYQFSRNLPLVYIKNMPTKLAIKYLPNLIYRYLRLMAARIIRGGFMAYVKGFFAFVRLLPYALKERKRIQKSIQITNNDVDKLLWHGKPGRFNV